MWRVGIMAVLCAAAGGCAMGGAPSISSFGFSGSSGIQPAPEEKQAAVEAPSGGSSLGSIWDNFSSAFRPGATPVSNEHAAAVKLEPDRVLSLINDYRSKRGLRPLTIDPRTTIAAETLAADMAAHDRMSHFGTNGEGVGERLTKAGYKYRVAAENIGAGQETAEEMIEGWKKSPPHSKNMLLKDAKSAGIAMQYRPESHFKRFWVLVVAGS